jgi:hypothetical protein
VPTDDRDEWRQAWRARVFGRGRAKNRGSPRQIGLMAAVFYSNRGHDEAAHDAAQAQFKR